MQRVPSSILRRPFLIIYEQLNIDKVLCVVQPGDDDDDDAAATTNNNNNECYQFVGVNVSPCLPIRTGRPTNTIRSLSPRSLFTAITFVYRLWQPPHRTVHTARDPMPAPCLPSMHWRTQKPETNMQLVSRLSKVRGEHSAAHSVAMLQKSMRIHHCEANLQFGRKTQCTQWWRRRRSGNGDVNDGGGSGQQFNRFK